MYEGMEGRYNAAGRVWLREDGVEIGMPGGICM